MSQDRITPEIYPCIMQEVNDSNVISRIGHYEGMGYLYLKIQFKNGDAYIYFGVTTAMYESFLMAKSKGRFYNNQIKGRFRVYRLV
jgi:hypothetical protein